MSAKDFRLWLSGGGPAAVCNVPSNQPGKPCGCSTKRLPLFKIAPSCVPEGTSMLDSQESGIQADLKLSRALLNAYFN